MVIQIFHQNMLIFGGANSGKNVKVSLAFQDIATRARASTTAPFVVAGFTEITNRTAARAVLSDATRGLNPAPGETYCIAVGISAVGVKEEWIVIRTFHDGNTGFTPESHGKVLSKQDNGTLVTTCYRHSATYPDDQLPPNTQPDARGLAYVVGQVTVAGAAWPARTPVIIGFMHNMYATGNSYVGRVGLSDMVHAIRDTEAERDPTVRDARFVLGGDFNVKPGQPSERPSRDKVPMTAVFAKDPVTHAKINTTNSNPYDFWYLPAGAPATTMADNAHVWPETRTPAGGPFAFSDHAAVSLVVTPDLFR